MQFINVLTNSIREFLVNDYMNLQEEFFNYGNDLERINNIENELYDDFECEVFLKMYNHVLKSAYKNIILLILLKDAYEYLTKKKNLLKPQKEILNYFKKNDLAIVFERLIYDKTFFIEISILFFEYNFDMDLKSINSTSHKQMKNLKIFTLDKIQAEIDKEGLN